MRLEGFDKAGFNDAVSPVAYVDPRKRSGGNFLTHMFPTIGGIGGGAAGGAAGGALAGTAVLPGVGTAVGGLLGALLGGAAGGATGKVVENKVEGKGLGSGVVGQALEQGALSAGPIRLGKAVIGGARALKGGAGLADALATAGEKGTAPSALRQFIANKGAQTEARAGGFGIGEKAAGSQPLGFYDSAAIRQTLKSEGIKPGSPEARVKAVEDALATHGQNIDTHLMTNNAVLKPAQRESIAQDFLKSISEQPGVDELTLKKATTLADNFLKQTSDVKSVVNFRRGLDKQVINFNQNPSTALAAKQLAARNFRDVLTNATEKLAPGITKANRSYADLAKAKEFLVGANKAVTDQSQGGGGVFGFLRSNDTAQAGKSVAGSLLQKAAPNEAKNAFGAKEIAGRALPVGALQAESSKPTGTPNAGQMPPETGMIPGSPTSPGAAAGGGLDPSSPFNPTNAQTTIEHIIANGGKAKDVSDYLNIVQAMQKLNPSGNGSPGYSKPSAAQYSQAVGGLQSIAQLEQMLGGSPGVVNKNAAPGQGLPLVGGFESGALGTSQYRALTHNILNSVARINTGAAMPPSEERFYEQTYLPQPGDSPQAQATKLANLRGFFTPIVSYSGPSTSASDLVSALGGTM